MLVAQKSIPNTTPDMGRLVSLITLIHITKLDYCMQYKSFVILGHAYFLDLYIQVARRLLAYKRWSVPTESVAGWVGWRWGWCKSVHRKCFPNKRPVASRQVCSQRVGRLLFANPKGVKRTLQEGKRQASPTVDSLRSSFWCLNRGKSKCWRVPLRCYDLCGI